MTIYQIKRLRRKVSRAVKLSRYNNDNKALRGAKRELELQLKQARRIQ